MIDPPFKRDAPWEALMALGDSLGIDQSIWATRESLSTIAYTATECRRDAVLGLSVRLLTSVVELYGDAFSCRFMLGDDPVLEIKRGLEQQWLDDFADRTHAAETVELVVHLDKKRLVDDWFGHQPDCRVAVYFFSTALEKLLAGGLAELDVALWSDDAPKKVIFLVPDRTIRLDGELLAIVGGDHMQSWPGLVPERPIDPEDLVRLRKLCRDSLKWQGQWFRHITPRHFTVENLAETDDPLSALVAVHLVNLAVLYTADRSELRDGAWVATYHGAKHSAEVSLPSASSTVGTQARLAATDLVRLFEWSYQAEWKGDRLQLVHIVIAQVLHGVDEATRYEALLRHSAYFLPELEWHWKALLDDRVDSYMNQVRALEDYVGTRLQAFSDQVSAMVKSLSDAMLAAVAAVVGSFVAALLKDKFEPLIFGIGLAAYATYLLLFPLLYNMSDQAGKFRAAQGDIDQHLKRFKARLGDDRVADIIGTRISASARRFWKWFRWAVVAYLVVFAVSVGGATFALRDSPYIASIWTALPGGVAVEVSPSPSPSPLASPFDVTPSPTGFEEGTETSP
ncbi:MAG: hypothetical protein IT305_12940 [Chloroflexi bacterium]|nr:hypothetical protein [Chloroflexota bacterium]